MAADLGNEEIGFQNFVIAHELLHLRIRNHGRLFKAFMTAHVPNWRSLAEKSMRPAEAGHYVRSCPHQTKTRERLSAPAGPI